MLQFIIILSLMLIAASDAGFHVNIGPNLSITLKLI